MIFMLLMLAFIPPSKGFQPFLYPPSCCFLEWSYNLLCWLCVISPFPVDIFPVAKRNISFYFPSIYSVLAPVSIISTSKIREIILMPFQHFLYLRLGSFVEIYVHLPPFIPWPIYPSAFTEVYANIKGANKIKDHQRILILYS